MPKRPRSHKLEDESRDALRSAITAAGWTFEDNHKDYGIDGRIEIFDSENNATSKFFFCQLKATDTPDLKKALFIKLRMDTYSYCMNLGCPVLLVLYHAPTAHIYVKWLHSHKLLLRSTDQKTCHIRLAPSDRWREGTPKRLEADFDVLNKAKGGHIDFPLHAVLSFSSLEVLKWDSTDVDMQLRSLCSQSSGLISFTSIHPEHAHLAVRFEREHFTVNLADAWSMRCPIECAEGEEYTLGHLFGDIMIVMAVVFSFAKQHQISHRLFLRYRRTANIVLDEMIAWLTARYLLKQGATQDFLDFCVHLLDREVDPSVVAEIIQARLFDLIPETDAHSKQLCGLWLRCADSAERMGQREIAANCHYNMANFARSESMDALAIRHYRKAYEFDQDYEKREYFWREFAGVLFNAGRYKFAARFYKKAIDLGNSSRSLPLYADALMYCGNYGESLAVWKKCRENEADVDEMAILITIVLPHIMGAAKTDRQRRNVYEAQEKALIDEKDLTDRDKLAENLQKVEQALELDGLCELAWFNSGVLWHEKEDNVHAMGCFLTSALINETSINAWCNAFFLAFTSLDSCLTAVRILQRAYRMTGEDFAKQLLDEIRGLKWGIDTRPFYRLVREGLDAMRKEPKIETSIIERSEGNGLTLRRERTYKHTDETDPT